MINIYEHLCWKCSHQNICNIPFCPASFSDFFQTDSAPQIWTDHQQSDKFDFNDVKLLHGGKNPPLAANKLWLHCCCIAVGPFEADDDADVKSVLEIKISSYWEIHLWKLTKLFWGTASLNVTWFLVVLWFMSLIMVVNWCSEKSFAVPRTCRKPLGSFSLMTSMQYSISPVVWRSFTVQWEIWSRTTWEQTEGYKRSGSRRYREPTRYSQKERFPRLMDFPVFHICIWERARGKHLGRGGLPKENLRSSGGTRLKK